MKVEEKIKEVGKPADPIRRFLEAYLEGYYDAVGYLDQDEKIEDYEIRENESVTKKGYSEGWNKAKEIFKITGGHLR